MLSRHGSRYPTLGSNVYALSERLVAARGKWTAKGALSFLNDWNYQLGAEILVPKGKYDAGNNTLANMKYEVSFTKLILFS
jgi:hypothetical protein